MRIMVEYSCKYAVHADRRNKQEDNTWIRK